MTNCIDCHEEIRKMDAYQYVNLDDGRLHIYANDIIRPLCMSCWEKRMNRRDSFRGLVNTIIKEDTDENSRDES